MIRGARLQRRCWGLLRAGGAALLCAAPALGASHTVSAGIVVYDGAVFGLDDISVEGADTVLEIPALAIVLNAISLSDGATLDNAGRVATGVAAGAGIVVNRTGGSIDSSGDGIYFELGGGVTNEAGASITGRTGIYSDWPSGAGPGEIVNAGTITGTDGAGIDLELGGTVRNEAGGTVSGTTYGVLGWDGVEVTNSGAGSRIEATESTPGTGLGVSLANGGAVSNSDGAAIAGKAVGVAIFDAFGEVTNSGGATILGRDNDGIYMTGGGTVTNSGAGSLIEGGWNAVHFGRDSGSFDIDPYKGTVINIGGAEIRGGGGISSAAIYLEAGGEVVNGAGSLISGDAANGVYGVYASQGTSLSNAGTITGDVRFADQRENHATLETGGTIAGDLYLSTVETASTLTLTGDGREALSEAVTGTLTFTRGALIKTGAGTWIIDKAGLTSLRAATVESGVLIVNHASSLSGTPTTVEAGGTLGGTGQVGKLVVASGGTVAPGNSIGTLNLAGAYQPAAGSTYDVELSGDGTADRIAASGAATIATGAQLRAIRYDAAPLTLDTRYTVLSAASRNGEFTLLDDGALTAFLRAQDSYDGTHAYLTIVQARPLAAAALTPNQEAAANGVQSVPSGPAFLALSNVATDSEARAALDQLSGEIHATALSAILAGAQSPREAALARLREALGPGARLWTRSHGGLGRVAADGNAEGASILTGGFLFGADGPVGRTGRAGVFGGAGQSRVEGDRGTADVTEVTLGAYGGAMAGPFALRAGATAGVDSIATGRALAIDGLRAALSARYGGTTLQGFAEIGLPLALGPVLFEPVAGVSYAAIRSTAYDEGSAGLAGKGGGATLGLTQIGLRTRAELDHLTLDGALSWQHALTPTRAASTHGLAGGTAFTTYGAPLPVDSLAAALSLDLALSDTATLRLGYAGTLAPGATSQSATVELRAAF